ncbi:MAG TPA: ATPase domain-containing protein [Candidatus Kapabacteria bacterium]|nr:ATPase domain-containing protein [Candidatus Kapabacteria bacterium]
MYTIEDIVHHTGIGENKAAELCSMLYRDGYLLFDRETGQYRLTDDRDHLKKIKAIWQQCKDEHSFAQMCGKIEDIIKFGKPLALPEDDPRITVEDVGIPGLNIIFGHPGSAPISLDGSTAIRKVPGLPVGHCLLIKGEPGTGKTTLGMQIALYLKPYRSLFLTFEEDIHQLLNDFKGYTRNNSNDDNTMGWSKDDIKDITRPLIKIRTPSAWKNPDVISNELISLLDRELPRLVVVDSISRFRDLGGEAGGRHILRKFIRNLKCRQITSIFTGEDRSDENAFEDYEADGIISLKWEGGLLTLTVKKLRGMKAYKGIHSAAMLAVQDLDEPENRLISQAVIRQNGVKIPYLIPGINVFPDISVYKQPPSSSAFFSSNETIGTGTAGLDQLLPLPGEKKGLKQGETLLLVGSAGTGKTILSLNFMREGYKKQENTVWINFEGDLGTLEFATRGFEGEIKEDFNKMLKSAKDTDPNSLFQFVDFSPIHLDLNKIVFALEALHARKNIKRLVIDSITELEKAKGDGQQALKVFLSGLIQFLRDRGITTIFVCRSDAFFKSIDKITEQISSLVDLIICIRNFDVHNQIQKGIYIQKARGRKHDSKISHMNIDSLEGIEIRDQGWDIENLLAGDTGNIQAPKVFFKFFYENPAEETINQKIIKDFYEIRYPGKVATFALVKKPHIYTEFWSFRGQFSAGHANTRVLSIEDYVVYAFRDNKRLAPLGKYVKGELLKDIEQDDHLRNLYPLPRKRIKKVEEEQFIDRIDAIPCYRDYGVMVFKELYDSQYPDLKNNAELIEFYNEIKSKFFKNQNKEVEDDWEWLGKEDYTWEYLQKQLEDINDIKTERKKKGVKQPDDILPFAFPSLDNVSEFVAFFMELLWSHGSDIYNIDSGSSTSYIEYEAAFLRNKKKIRESILIDFLAHYIKNGDTVVNELIISELLGKDDFDARFEFYGLRMKGIKIEKFKKWLGEQFEPFKGLKKDSLESSTFNLNDDPFKDTIKLMLGLVHRGGVKNPAEGEFRHRALLSRNWYSRVTQPQKDRCNICSDPDSMHCVNRTDSNKDKCKSNYLKSANYHLLPLPLATIKADTEGEYKYYRSITCFTNWSLTMLDNALSPEIGGNFIESINAPDYYQQRLSDKAGMPIANREVNIKKYHEFDRESYTIFERILNNRHEYEDTKRKVEAIKEKIKNLTDETELNSKKEEIEKILSEQNAFICKKFRDAFKEEDVRKEYVKNNKEAINKRAFYFRERQTRIGFYQIEEALHFELKRLFIPDNNDNPKDVRYRGEDNQEWRNIYQKLKEASENRNPTADDEAKLNELLKEISEEFRLHVIFEMLTYFYHEYILKDDDYLDEKEKEEKKSDGFQS